jgi:uncharacterized protein YgiM (DUF1202 family)
VSWKCIVLAYVMLAIALSPLLAAETRYVSSEHMPLNVHSGPETNATIVARLAHGTQVSLLERWGVWAKIMPAQGDTAGWVLQRYLAPHPPSPAESQMDMSTVEEQRRFARLQRKGILTVQRPGNTGVLTLTISALIWRHLTPQEQQNVLQRAQRLFGGTTVEIHAQQNEGLLARLTATGAFESVAGTAAGHTPSNEAPPQAPFARPQLPGPPHERR